jgi:hypothetical protein
MNRRALFCLAVPALALAARPARAFREAPASDSVAQDWASRCGSHGLPAAVSGPVAICPFCGCPVVGARDHGEGAAKPPG